jgi:hypothetical protein
VLLICILPAAHAVAASLNGDDIIGESGVRPRYYLVN